MHPLSYLLTSSHLITLHKKALSDTALSNNVEMAMWHTGTVGLSGILNEQNGMVHILLSQQKQVRV